MNKCEYKSYSPSSELGNEKHRLVFLEFNDVSQVETSIKAVCLRFSIPDGSNFLVLWSGKIVGYIPLFLFPK